MNKRENIPGFPPGARRARYFFDKFLHTIGGIRAGKPESWKDFYRFVHAAHQGRLGFTGEELAKILLGKGLDAKKSSMLACIYERGRGLLKARPAFNYIKLKASNYDMDKGWDEIDPTR
jgi:hypothetical protein